MRRLPAAKSTLTVGKLISHIKTRLSSTDGNALRLPTAGVKESEVSAHKIVDCLASRLKLVVALKKGQRGESFGQDQAELSLSQVSATGRYRAQSAAPTGMLAFECVLQRRFGV